MAQLGHRVRVHHLQYCDGDTVVLGVPGEEVGCGKYEEGAW